MKKTSHLSPAPEGFYIQQLERTTPLNMSREHYHDAYEIYYLRSGERYYFINDQTYHIRSGDLVLIDKLLLHKTLTITPSHERVLLHYRDDFLDPIIRCSDWNPQKLYEHCVIRLNIKQQAVIEGILEKLMIEHETPTPESSLYVKVALTELLLYASRCKRENNNGMDGSNPSNPMFDRVSSVAVYINEHFQKRLTLTGVAECFHINPQYLSRIFTKTTGFTFIEYINLVRLKEARQLLVSSDSNITQIAELVGFESLSHFGRVFKEETGLSPKAFRHTHKESKKER